MRVLEGLAAARVAVFALVLALGCLLFPSVAQAQTISIADVSRVESAANIPFTIQLSSPAPAGGTRFRVTASNGTATAGADYSNPGPLDFTIAQGSSRATFTLPLFDDPIDEANETINVAITNIIGATAGDVNAVGTIIDDDEAAGLPSLSINDVSVTEGNAGTTNATFTVSLSAPAPAGGVTFNVLTANGTATTPSDYFSSALLGQTIAAGQTSRTFTVTVIGDTVPEADETFFIAIQSPVGAILSDGLGQGTILNDDSAPPILSINDVTVFEGNGGTTNAVFTVSLSAPAPAGGVTYNIATNAGTATPPSDFVNQALFAQTIAAGQTSRTFTVLVNGDTMVEGSGGAGTQNETFFVDVSNVIGAIVGDSRGVGTINDDDLPRSLTISSPTVTEGNAGTVNAVFTITASPNAGPEGMRFDITTVNGTAIAGQDYVAQTQTGLFIAPNETSRTFSVAVNGDLLIEGNETFLARISNVVGGFGAGQATATIIDDDGVPAVSIADVALAEGNSGTTNANFTVTLSAPGERDAVFSVAAVPDTATTPSDFTPPPATLTIAAGQRVGTVSVPIVGDTGVEPDERFFVTLTPVSGAVVADSQAIGTITNDDVLPTLNIANVTVTEGNVGATTTAAFAVTLSAPAPAGGVRFDIATVNGTATAGTDFTAFSLTGHSIAAGATSFTFNVNVTGDRVNERDEQFTVLITNVTGAALATGQATGTIINDDPVPSISITDSTVVEGNSGQLTGNYTISLSGPTDQIVSFRRTSTNGSAVSPGDYIAFDVPTQFAPGIISSGFVFSYVGDTLVEGNENFVINLSDVTNATVLDAQSIVTITDDDVAVLPTLSIGDVTVTEGNSGTVNAVFAITLSAPAPAGGVRYDVATANQTATAGADYVAQTLTGQTIAAGSTTGTFTVQVNGDVLDEANERFFATITNLTGALPGTLLGAATITDDDAPPSLSVDDISFAEGNDGATEAVFSIRLSAPSGQTVTALGTLADGTATAPVDYIPFTGAVIFQPGETLRRIGLPVNGDTLVEADETFSFNLSAPQNATIADGQGIATIRNDDAPPELAITNAVVVEGNSGTSSATFAIILSSPAPPGGVSFDLATADGTANAGSDYVGQPLTRLTISEGEIGGVATIPVNGDLLNEADETFFVNISNVTGATLVGARGQATITNDDALPSLSINDVRVTEGNSGTATATFTVSLSVTSGQTVTVNHAAFNGTATSPGDYAAVTGQLTFAPGLTSRTISVPVTGDLLAEADETFSVALSGAVNATLTDGEGVGTIANDDVPVTVTTTGLAAGTAGVGYSQAIGATGGISPYRYEFAAGPGTLPPGLTLSPNGVVSGTPTAAGTFTFRVIVTDSTPAPGPISGEALVTIVINPPTITLPAATLAGGTRGLAYSAALPAATGGNAPYRYAVTGGALPTGLTLDTATGAISGTPTALGAASFTVTATDSTGGGLFTAVQSYGITIVDALAVPANSSLTVGYNAAATSVPLTISGGTPLSLTITTPPVHGTATVTGASISYQPATGYAGPDNFGYSATNSGGTSAGAVVSVTVGNPSFTITAAGGLSASVAAAYSQTFNFAGGAAPFTAQQVTGLPAGLRVSGTTATSVTISGTPTQAGSFALTVSATDSSRGAGPFTPSQGFTLNVAAPVLSLAPGAGTLAAPYAAPFSQAFTATGGTGSYSYALTGALPTGLSFNAGTISGTATTPGSFAISVTATDTAATGVGAPFSVTQAYTINVAAPVIAIAPAALGNAAVGVPFAQTFTANGGSGAHVVTLSSGRLPAGLAFAGAALTGTPREAGSFTLTLTGTDAFGQTGTRAYTLVVAAPALTLAPGAGALTAPYAAPFSQVFTAAGGTGSYTYSLTGALPAGLSFNGGTMSGTATTPGNFAISVTATDSAATGVGAPFSVTQAYTVRVAAPVILIAPGTLPAATAGRSYAAALTASGGAGPYSFALVGGALPAGVTLNPAGQFAGTPTVAGSFAITVQARDANGQTGNAPLTLVVGLPVLTVTPPTLPSGRHGIAYSATLSASGGIAPYRFAIGTGALPPGLTLNPATGVISGTPTDGLTASFTIIVTDSTGGTPATLTVPYTLVIAARPDPARDPEVTGLMQAVTNATRRFADAQMDNFIQRMETMHGEGSGNGDGGGEGAGIRFHNNVRLATRDLCRDALTLMTNAVCVNPARVSGIIKLNGWTAADTGETAGADVSGVYSNANGGGGGADGLWTIWTSGSVRFGEREAATGRVAQEFESEGITLGADYRFSPEFGAGIGLGLGRETADVGKNGSQSRGEAKTVALYGSYQLGKGIYLDWVGGYQSLDFDLRRYVSPTGAMINSQRKGHQWFGTLSAGTDIISGNLQLTPFARLELTRAKLDGYTERSGSPFDLAFLDQNVNFTSLVAGTRFKYRHATAWGMLLPQLRAEYQWNVERSADGRVAYADRINNPFSVVPLSGIGREEVTLGARMEAIIERLALSIALEYIGRFSSGGGSDNMFQIGLKHEF